MDGWGVRYRGVGPLDFSEGKEVLLMVGVCYFRNNSPL